MGFLIIAVILGGIAFWLSRPSKNNLFSRWSTVIFLLFSLATISIMTGILVPTGGFAPPEEIRTIELEVLTDNVVSFKNFYDEYAITVVEEENCVNPRMVEYIQRAKPTFWSFGLMYGRKVIVFYLPKGINPFLLAPVSGAFSYEA